VSTQDPAGPDAGQQPEPSEQEREMMAAYEEQMRNIRVEEVLVQSLASFIELGGRRAGLAGAPDQAGAPDPDQLGLAIEVIRALQPLAAPLLGPNSGQVDQALSQLQIAYTQLTGTQPAPPAAGGGPAGGQGGPGAAGGGRLWVPGQ
jgi:hypothetical protein